MNSPIPSLLLPLWQSLWQNKSLCETINMKILSPVRSFARKSSHFHVKRFAQALVLQTATRKWKQSLYTYQAAHQDSAYFSFCSMKRLGVFLLPAGWDAGLSHGYPQTLNLPVTIYTPERILRHCQSSASPKNTILARARNQTARNTKEIKIK